MIKRFIKNEDGQGLVEYIILAALMAIAIITAVSNLGGRMKGKFKDVEDAIK